jgi:ribose transport system permease protein
MSVAASEPNVAAGPTATTVVDLSIRERLWRSLRTAGPIFLVLAALIVAIYIKQPHYNFVSMLKSGAPLAILAAGQLFVIVSGEIDLSVGSLITVTVSLAASIIKGDPNLMLPVMGVLIVLGLAVGLVNGVITTRLGVPSFVTTLGMLLILVGAIGYITGGSPIGNLTDNFRVFGRESFNGVPIIGQLPFSVVILAVVGVVTYWLLHRTNYGRQLFAVGGNARAAELAGINVAVVRTIAFVLSALAAVLAGILLGGFAGVSAQVGKGFEFQAITAVVIGGAVLGGGRGSIPTAIAGALTLQALFVLLNVLGQPQPIRDTVQGLIVIGAVAYASYRLRRSR